MNTTQISLTISVLACSALTLLAVEPVRHPRGQGVTARQRIQHDRIRQGVRSGELTKDETKSLAAGQRAVRTEKRAYKSDGQLTAEERNDLHQDQNEQSKAIYAEKHDAEKRAKAK